MGGKVSVSVAVLALMLMLVTSTEATRLMSWHGEGMQIAGARALLASPSPQPTKSNKPDTVQPVKTPNTVQPVKTPNTVQPVKTPNTVQQVKTPNTVQQVKKAAALPSPSVQSMAKERDPGESNPHGP